MVKKRQTGFTLFELLVSASLFAVLSGLTVISLQDYSQQARILKGLTLAASVKVAVVEFYSRSGKFPASSIAASIDSPEGISDAYVKSVGISDKPADGTITITYRASGSIAEGDTLLLIPSRNNRSIDWKCQSRTIIANLLPDHCV